MKVKSVSRETDLDKIKELEKSLLKKEEIWNEEREVLKLDFRSGKKVMADLHCKLNK